jgi:hypothetical protein
MADSFSILHVAEYLKRLGLKFPQVNDTQNTIELTFTSEYGQWRMIVGIHHSGSASKLMLIAPNLGTVTAQKRLACLEALLTVNYRIALGKFGIDPADGEVRLEESIPLAEQSVSFEQFRLAFSALIQTVSIYQDLLPRIIYGDISAHEAIKACEDGFFNHTHHETEMHTSMTMAYVLERQTTNSVKDEEASELDVDEVLAEVAFLFKKRQG